MSTSFYNTASNHDNSTVSNYARRHPGSSIVYPPIGEEPLITDPVWLANRARNSGAGDRFCPVFDHGQHAGRGRSGAEFDSMGFCVYWCNQHWRTSIAMYMLSYWYRRDPKHFLLPDNHNRWRCYGEALYHDAVKNSVHIRAQHHVYRPSKHDLAQYRREQRQYTVVEPEYDEYAADRGLNSGAEGY